MSDKKQLKEEKLALLGIICAPLPPEAVYNLVRSKNREDFYTAVGELDESFIGMSNFLGDDVDEDECCGDEEGCMNPLCPSKPFSMEEGINDIIEAYPPHIKATELSVDDDVYIFKYEGPLGKFSDTYLLTGDAFEYMFTMPEGDIISQATEVGFLVDLTSKTDKEDTVKILNDAIRIRVW
jgi:hypothetical protein